MVVMLSADINLLNPCLRQSFTVGASLLTGTCMSMPAGANLLIALYRWRQFDFLPVQQAGVELVTGFSGSSVPDWCHSDDFI